VDLAVLGRCPHVDQADFPGGMGFADGLGIKDGIHGEGIGMGFGLGLGTHGAFMFLI
jgi:hypothetical protein